MSKVKVAFTLNDQEVSLLVQPEERLLDTIRDRLNLTGTKEGCGVGECGACTVMLDGQVVNSCLVLTAQVYGREVRTVEGLGGEEELDKLQQAFIDHQAVQCGFCTPGMLMSARALLDDTGSPTREEIKTALDGNLCRCTGYKQIVEAVEAAAEAEEVD